MDQKVSVQKMFRVQGGIFPNRSRTYLKVENNKLFSPVSKAVHISDMEHMTHFLFKRLGISNIDELGENLSKYDINVVEMHMPYWFNYLLDKYAVDSVKTRNKSLPRLVDKSTPGHSYSVRGAWADLLRNTCLFAQNNEIRKKQDIYKLILPSQLEKSKVSSGLSETNVKKISEIIKQCNIDKADIDTLKEVWNLDLDMTNMEGRE